MGVVLTANIVEDFSDANDEQNDDENDKNRLYGNVAIQIRALDDSIVIHCKFISVSPSRRAFYFPKKTFPS
jgi:hypothetical protein